MCIRDSLVGKTLCHRGAQQLLGALLELILADPAGEQCAHLRRREQAGAVLGEHILDVVDEFGAQPGGETVGGVFLKKVLLLEDVYKRQD